MKQILYRVDIALYVHPKNSLQSHLRAIIGGFILSLVSIPQAYLRRSSDVNGSNFSISRLLCSLGNACSSALYQNKIRKLKHQSNSFASGGKLKTRTSHSIAYFRAKVYEQRKEHGNPNFYQRRPYFRVLDDGDDYFDQGLM